MYRINIILYVIMINTVNNDTMGPINIPHNIFYFVTGFVLGSIIVNYYNNRTVLISKPLSKELYRVHIYDSKNVEIFENYYIDYIKKKLRLENALKNVTIIIKSDNKPDIKITKFSGTDCDLFIK